VGVAAQIASTGGGNIGTEPLAQQHSDRKLLHHHGGPASPTTTCGRCWPTNPHPFAGTGVTQSNEERAARGRRKAERAERWSQAEAASKAGAGAASLFTAAFANQPAGDGKNDVAVNPVAGTVSVLGTAKQQELVQQYLDRVMQSAQRQVLIEATIVEVTLKDQYRAGIDWSRALQGSVGWKIDTIGAVGGSSSNALAGSLAPFVQATYNGGNGFKAASTAGVLRQHQGAVEPQADGLEQPDGTAESRQQLVYFTVKADTVSTANVGATTTFTTTPQTVPVGVVMSVLPQINENGLVSLTVRPTITRKVGDVDDPNPDLKNAQISNKIPVIQVREMESLLQVRSGQTVILGGLIQDDTNNARDGLPGLSRPVGIGAVFGQHERV